ncbi:MAG TPA: mechanosensitive ion channel domain-containing protein [Alphaproteobacteria bacterium]|nr:mechanosensitive ion channel domain-containing protein [Alphaproteobacteria bacterium]
MKWEDMLKNFWDPSNWLGASIYAVLFFIAAMFISRLIRLAAGRILRQTENELVDPTIVLFLTQLAQIATYIVGLIIYFHIVPALNRLGTALLTGVSVVSVVFGLAAQNTLSNLVAGCTLLLYRPFHIDDLIQVATPTGTEMGIVERLTLGYTMLRTTDDRLVIVPNSLMASQVSLNLNRRSLHVMAIIPVGVRDSHHLGDVRKVLMEYAHADTRIHKLEHGRPQRLDDGSAIITLRCWCDNEAEAKAVKEDITDAMKKHFAGKHIIIMPSSPKPHPVAQTPAPITKAS